LRNECRLKWLHSNSSNDKLRYDDAKRRSKATLRRKKRAYQKELIASIEASKKNLKMFYDFARKARGHLNNRPTIISDNDGNLDCSNQAELFGIYFRELALARIWIDSLLCSSHPNANRIKTK